MKNQVMTVRGPISPDDLGITLCHMHTTTNVSNWYVEPRESSMHWIIDAPVTLEIRGILRMDPTCCKDNLVTDEIDLVIEEMQELTTYGCKTIVDTLPHTLLPTRDPLAMRRVSISTGIHIICASGWYVEGALPPYVRVKTVDELCDIVVKELTEGCRYNWDSRPGYPLDADGIKAGIIKVGVGTDPHSPFTNDDEKKCFLACCKAQAKTGKPFTIHPNVIESMLKKPIKESCLHYYLDLMEKEGVNLEKFYMSHADWWTNDLDLLKSLMDRGIGLSFDGFNEEEYFISLGYGLNFDNRQRMETLVKLIEAGYEEQLLPSCECFMKIHYKKYGGYGFSHVLKYIIPILRHYYKVSDKAINAMLVENPTRYLAY